VGIYAICAFVKENTRNYGYISDLPISNVGEVIDGQSMKEIADMVCEDAKTLTPDRLQ
jgi:hypothetical protein